MSVARVRSRTVLRRALGVALGLGLTLAGGCGSSGRSKEERAFIAKVNAVCRDFAASRANTDLASQAPKATPAERARRFGERYRLRQRELQGFRAIKAPPKERARFSRFVSAYGRRVALTRSSQDAAARNDLATLRSNGRQDRVFFVRSTRLAGKLGFTACGRRTAH
jgi:hypothetical protein